MKRAALRYRLLLVGRAHFAGILGGVAYGEAVWLAWAALAMVGGGPDGVVSELVFFVVFSPIAGTVGGAVGGAIGMVAGLVLALSSRQVLSQMGWSRLVTGTAAAAVPLVVVLCLPRANPSPDYLVADVIAVVAAVTAVLVTPYILHGPSPRAEWRRGIPPQAPASPPAPDRGRCRTPLRRLH
jgi:hypothetical protein